MAQIKPEWEIVKEAEEIVSRLCELYPDKLGHINPEAIGCAQVINKEKPDSSATLAKIVGIKAPVSLYCTKQYVIAFFKNTWDELNKPQKSVLIMSMLLRIPDDSDGGILAEDLKDLKVLVRAFGVDYLDSPRLPDLTADKYVF
jgi:predicted metallopeptidase